VDLQFVLQIRDIEQLNRILAETKKLKGVLSVERVHH
jgi:(p)ppGpp synthase/HD superfamily hydrolase